MAIKVTGIYMGDKQVKLTHVPSQTDFFTDAPQDNEGKGTSFAPTDLVGTALGSCMVTIIGIVAERYKIDVTGMHMEVEKYMEQHPRRIGRLPVKIWLPKSLTEAPKKKTGNCCEILSRS